MTTPAERALRYDREHARSLRALAYRMLGSRSEAEDTVQEAWLRWANVDESTVQHAGAYLSRLVTNLCLDKLGSAAAKREHYVGVWLPEPLLDEEAGWSPGPEAQAEFAQDVSVAFMLALERLSPLERAVFLLHEVFDVDFDEIGRRLERSPAACRQLASRARNHVKADYARREVEEEERERLFGAFSEAVRNLDVDALAKVLTEDAVMLADGGGKVSAVPRPLQRRRADRQDLHRLRQAAERAAPGAWSRRASTACRAAWSSTMRPGSWCRRSRWRPRPPSRAASARCTFSAIRDKLQGVLAALRGREPMSSQRSRIAGLS